MHFWRKPSLGVQREVANLPYCLDLREDKRKTRSMDQTQLLATDLLRASLNLKTEPLKQGHPFYVDLSAVTQNVAVSRLEAALEEALLEEFPTMHLAFEGHRGCGKSTELNRVAENLKDNFFSVHLYLDGSLSNDLDYPDLLLWMVESIAKELHERGMNPPAELVEKIGAWFAEVTEIEQTMRKAELTVQAEAQASTAADFFGNGYKLLARLKSAVSGNAEFKRESRRRIKNNHDQLFSLVNTFLLNAQQSLGGKKLLIIQDNLDRLEEESAYAIFKTSGNLLKRLEGVFIWTVPVGSRLSFNIGTVFDNPIFLPLISLRNREGTVQEKLLALFKELLGKRLSLEDCFDNTSIARQDETALRDLILYSGGSVRDLLKLTATAATHARVKKRQQIMKEDVEYAACNLALGIMRVLSPSTAYGKVLVALHKTKALPFTSESEIEDAKRQKEVFHTLVDADALFVYNGASIWYDIHPALLSLQDFQSLVQETSV